jgi:hypothetical protein
VSHLRKHHLGFALSVIGVLCALIGAASASAATVVNGDFESGTLTGWTLTQSTNGSWFASSGSQTPFGPEREAEEEEEIKEAEEEGEAPPPFASYKFFPPPSGNFGAVTDENGPSSMILSQDVALGPGYHHELSLYAYYRSFAAIAVPMPNSFETEIPQANQQFRIDVMKAAAPIESLNPSDILATVFATSAGAPEAMAPTRFTADLTPFAGQTVRLRIAAVDNSFYLNGGVDDVAIASTPILAPAPVPPSNTIVKGKLTLNKKNGSASLAITVPGAGTLSVADAATKVATASTAGKTAKKSALIKAKTLHPTAAGTVKVPIKPTAAGLKVLAKKGKLKFRARVTFTPTGGTAAAKTYAAKLVKTLKPHK